MTEQNLDMEIDLLEEQQRALLDQDLDDEKALYEFEELANDSVLNEEKEPTTKIPMNNDNKEKEEAIPRPEAIFLHGLDEMSTKDIRAYCNDLPPLEKIEWINDTSCNLIFNNEESAKQAIQNLLASDINDPVTHHILRKAKAYTQENSNHIFNNLHIRVATTWDIKEPGARDRSRYYLLHGSDDDNSFDRSELPRGGIFDRLGNRRKESTRHRQQQQQRRRSLSPQSSHHHHNRSARNDNEDNLIQIPDSLKGRIGSRRPR
ncbi:hypothetical protein BDC45DRAFT_246227 [Circinella umbellata]|nr:hypothetical protein BDC45DRAFT_246227 [Circinella umbellata]